MGWWHIKENEPGVHTEKTDLTIGDGPADIMDKAIEAIVKNYKENIGRSPYKVELDALLAFCLRAFGLKERP